MTIEKFLWHIITILPEDVTWDDLKDDGTVNWALKETWARSLL
jgi:hypothetical protein